MMLATLTETFTSSTILVHLGALALAAGLLVRDQLKLRLLILCGTTFYGLFYFFGNASPLWVPLTWSFVQGAANLSVIVRLLIERTTFNMSPREKALYRAFSLLSPGEFRRLLRVCAWQDIETETDLTREDAANDRLYYILSGKAEVTKSESRFHLDEGSFVGELSYLIDAPASATVRAEPGAVVASWAHADLRRVERRHPAIQIAMREILNVDLVGKVRRGRRA
jgi:hypothetical protein